MREGEPTGIEIENQMSLVTPDSGKKYFELLKDRRKFDRDQKAMIEGKFNRLPTYAKIAKLGMVKDLPESELHRHFSREDIESAINELEVNIQRQISVRGENGAYPYYVYCLDCLKNGRIPMYRTQWAKKTTGSLLREKFDAKTSGNKVFQGEWESASPQSSDFKTDENEDDDDY